VVPTNTHATVSVPTSTPVEYSKATKKAAQAEGVEFVSANDGYAQFQVGAGTYEFTSPIA
jgi:hypothetical protein